MLLCRAYWIKNLLLKSEISIMEIDFVVTWVDGNDPEWQKEKSKYSGKSTGDDRVKRYRDWDLLRYWFRGIEKCAPWVHAVHFVTCGHLPEWLNTDNPKLHIVNHKDYIPEKYLPTFSCRPIELNIHKIPGLSDDFVYFNDDMFLLQTVTEKDFFIGGRPCDTAILQASYIHGEDTNGEKLKPENYNTSNLMNLVPINRNFHKKESVHRNLGKWFSPKYGTAMGRTLLLMPWKEFTGFKNLHLPYSYNKKTFEEAWEKEEYLLDRACSHKFRDSTDVSSRMMSFWQIAEGNFAPRSPKTGQYYSICDNAEKNEKLFEAVKTRKHKMVCINDEYSGNEFEQTRQRLIDSFEIAFPEKSAFEK